MTIYYIDGEFLESEKAGISINDLIVLRGYGVFDFMRTYNRTPFMLREHISRLMNSAEQILLKVNQSEDEIFNAVMETIDKNSNLEEMNVRIICTGGISSDGVTPQGNGKLIVMITGAKVPPKDWYTEGVKVISEMTERNIPVAKSTDYLSAIVAQRKASKEGAVEAIYTDRNRNIHEGTTTNIFFFKENRLITPDRGILPGITRSVILDLSKEIFDIELRDISYDEIGNFDEAFISASNKEIVPVVSFDDIKIGTGKPGLNTVKLMKKFKDFTKDYGRN